MTSTDDIFGLSVAKGGGPLTASGSAPETSPPRPRRRDPSVEELVSGVLEGDRALMGRAISLVESRRPDHANRAQELLTALMPHTGRSMRVGITGVPGAGKSTFVERLGTHLTGREHRVAVLAVDPSSGRSGGSILGDKTRMMQLSVDPNAFIRPSPSGSTLGGVARKTRETLVVCEAAGFDVVLVETVGVGQSETMVAEMTDFFLALMVPGAGDELQGIKRGLIELVDAIAINKADSGNEQRAARAAREYANAVHYMLPKFPEWLTPVVTCSAKTGAGIEELWDTIAERLGAMRRSGQLHDLRQKQMLRWLNAMVSEELSHRFEAAPGVQQTRAEIEERVVRGQLSPTLAARQLLDAFESKDQTPTAGSSR